MNPRWLLSVALKRRALVIAAAVLGAAVAIGVHQVQPRLYTSSFEVRIERPQPRTELEFLQQQFTNQGPRVDAIRSVFESLETFKMALEDLGELDPGQGSAAPAGSSPTEGLAMAEALKRQVRVSAVDPVSWTVTVSVSDPDSDRAFRRAEAILRAADRLDRRRGQEAILARLGRLNQRRRRGEKLLSGLEAVREAVKEMQAAERDLAAAEEDAGRAETALRAARDEAATRYDGLRQRFDETWWEVGYTRSQVEALDSLLAGGPAPDALRPLPAWQDQASRLDRARQQIRQELERLDPLQFRMWRGIEEATREADAAAGPAPGASGVAGAEAADLQVEEPAPVFTFADLEARIQSARSDLDAINRDFGQIRTALETTPAGFAQEVPPTRSLRPSSPRLGESVLIGFLAFLALAFVVVYLAEFMDASLRRVDDIEFYAHLDVLGTVPHLPATEEGLTSEVFRNPQAFGGAIEAFRSIKSALGFVLTGVRAPILLVNSPSPAEGKTTVALNLAHAWAEEGRRTVIVSANIRHPSIQAPFGIGAERPGLSEYLDGGLSAGDLIQPTAMANLFLAPAGRPATNSSVLLQRPALEELLRYLRENFDGVIIDSPPSLWLSDAAVIAPHVDAVLMVCALAETNRQDLARALRLFRRATAKPILAIANARAAFLRVETRPYYYAYAYQQKS